MMPVEGINSVVLTVLARVTPKAEFFWAVRDVIFEIIVATRGEPGCHAFNLYSDEDDHGRFYLYEIWENEAAFQEHREKPHTRAATDKCREWLVDPVEVTRLHLIYKEHNQ
jgi:quinol monooxygenase YgiN